jgi:hypothetical protein
MTLCMSMCMRHGFFPIAASKHQKLPEANTIADTLLDIVIIVGYGYSPEEIIALGGYSYKFKFSQHTPLMHAHAYACSRCTRHSDYIVYRGYNIVSSIPIYKY